MILQYNWSKSDVSQWLINILHWVYFKYILSILEVYFRLSILQVYYLGVEKLCILLVSILKVYFKYKWSILFIVFITYIKYTLNVLNFYKGWNQVSISLLEGCHQHSNFGKISVLIPHPSNLKAVAFWMIRCPYPGEIKKRTYDSFH